MRKRLLLGLVLLFVSLGVQAKNHRIGILVWNKVLTSDITAPMEVFGSASRQAWFSNYHVELVSVDGKTDIVTEEGLPLKLNRSIDDAGQFDVLIVPSAYDMAPLLKNAKLIRFLQQQAPKLQWLASNCSGVHILAKAGLIDGKQATTWAGGEAELAKAFPAVKVVYDQNVVIDGNILTSNGGVVSYQAALQLLAQISSKARALEVMEALQLQRIAAFDL